jgi:hypothetical protein
MLFFFSNTDKIMEELCGADEMCAGVHHERVEHGLQPGQHTRHHRLPGQHRVGRQKIL